MNNKEITIAKFQACTGINKVRLNSWSSSALSHKDYKLTKFETVLRGHQMSAYNFLLYNYMKEYAVKKPSGSDNTNFEQVRKKSLSIEREILEVLMFLLSDDKVDLIVLKKVSEGRQESNNKIGIKEGKVTDTFLKWAGIGLISLLKKRRMNQRELTISEAVDEIKNNIDEEWVTGWKSVLEYVDSEGNKIVLEDFETNNKYRDLFTGEFHSKEDIMNQMASEYAIAHNKTEPVTIELIKRLLSEMDNKPNEAGRKEETRKLKQIAFTLSNLIRLDRYIADKTAKNIKAIELQDTDYRFIHDVMAFFHFIDDYTTIPKNIPKLKPRIRQLLARNKSISFKFQQIQRINALRDQLNYAKSFSQEM